MRVTDIPSEFDNLEGDGIEGLLGQLPFFAELPATVRQDLSASADLVSYCAGDTILVCGQDDGATLVGVIDGEVQRTRGAPAAGDISVDVLPSGSVLGLSCLAHRDNRYDPTLALTAVTDAQLLMIDRDAVIQQLDRVPTYLWVLVAALADELGLMERENDVGVGASRRIYRHLATLIQMRDGKPVIDPMPRHKALAEAAGVTEQNAARAIAILLRERIISRQFPVAIVEDPDRLRAYGQ